MQCTDRSWIGWLLVVGVLLESTLAATTMWFNSTNIIPIGNGRLGAEVFGQIPTEVLVLNEDRIWSGSINDPNNRNCPGVLKQVRQYIWEDDLYNAQSTISENCMATPLKQQVYQTAGNLTLKFPALSLPDVTNYNHSLDLTTALSTTTYVFDGVQYERTAFASHPDNVIVLKITANETGKVEFEAAFITPMDNAVYTASENSITMTGRGTEMYTRPGSINYLARAEISVSGEKASVTPGEETITVSGADEALILIAIDTNYIRYDDITGDPDAKVSATLDAVRGKTWDELLDTHLSDYQALFGRVTISLGTPTNYTYLPTNLRKDLRGGGDADQDIFALYAQYGRYLGIASSRKTEPSNLQGIWNQELSPDWGSKYTLNINQQMNSWFAEPLNLAETLDPLWNLITELAERGKDTAAEEYNITRGWTAHHNTNIWRDSAPIDSAFHGFWTPSTAWLAQNIWEHYAFDPSLEEWVRDVAYPLMKGLCEFYLDFLVATPPDVESEEYLVTNPSASPEIGIGDYNGENVSMTYGSTVDTTLLRDLFNHTIGFASMLGVDSDLVADLTDAMSRLLPFRIGSRGQIQEYARDYNNYRVFTHISHMYPLFPGAQIDPRFNTTLSEAAKVSLQIRGDAGNGWPTAWRANCFARLLDGEKAYYYMQRLLHNFSYDNLWSYNSIFQIDGNFGGANAVAEMILQSQNGEIHLLPAIPKSWKEGSVTGFRARGGFTLDITWSEGALVSAKIKSMSGMFARVRYDGNAIDLTFEKGTEKTLTISNF
ncbi:large secreted protein [Moniliophthora roreri MCA 2997]|uniref:Large secreted protein n=1 Tax=Moniliophthora roreri (strain MCA 2997) TaxID=1381753 RepID=V2X473_MONRO|nr:large secreted protein [Moniliophthora roreri MCA 2997]